MIISEAWKLYEKDKRLLNYSENTLGAYKIQTRLLIRGMGDIHIERVALVDLKQYLLGASKNLKPSSLNHRIRFIKSLFHWAHDEGIIPRNISSKIQEAKEGYKVPNPLGEESLEILRDSCITNRERAIFEIFFASGCRLNEITTLNKDDINWNNKSFVVDGKGGKQRECFFTTRTAVQLKKYLNSRKDNDPALFVTERAPHRISKERIREIIKEIGNRSDLDMNIYPHRIRKSMASHMLDNGASLEEVADMLGHASTRTTLLYCKLTGERRRQIYNKYM